MTWQSMNTDQKIDAIRKVWQPGMSASEIADRIDGCPSRNAVIGIFHRHADKLAPVYITGRSRSKHSRPMTKLHVASGAPVTLMGLDGHTCRFPVGEATGEHQLFCGQWCDVDQPYCDRHADIATGTGTESERSAVRSATHTAKEAA